MFIRSRVGEHVLNSTQSLVYVNYILLESILNPKNEILCHY